MHHFDLSLRLEAILKLFLVLDHVADILVNLNGAFLISIVNIDVSHGRMHLHPYLGARCDAVHTIHSGWSIIVACLAHR